MSCEERRLTGSQAFHLTTILSQQSLSRLRIPTRAEMRQKTYLPATSNRLYSILYDTFGLTNHVYGSPTTPGVFGRLPFPQLVGTR